MMLLASKSADAGIFTGLGFYPPSSFSQARGVSGDGIYVVGVSGVPQAFRWSQATGIVGIGDLPGGFFRSEASGVSADGTVVVGTSASSNGVMEAFRWTPSTGMLGLGSLTTNGFQSEAFAVSGDGHVVVGRTASTRANGTNEAFTWTQTGGMVGLGFLPGHFESSARSTSADGSTVVGVSIAPSGDTEAFRWTTGTGMVGLGDLAGGNFMSRAFAVSANGNVIVGFGSIIGGTEAFRWTADGGMKGLGDLPGGSHDSVATSTNGDGSVVVGAARAEPFLDVKNGITYESAFIWDEATGLRNLRDILISEYRLGPQLAGWHLTVALSVSEDGQTIVGYGMNPNGDQEAWIARLSGHTTVPEPSSFALILMASSCLMLFRSRTASCRGR